MKNNIICFHIKPFDMKAFFQEPCRTGAPRGRSTPLANRFYGILLSMQPRKLMQSF